MKDKYFLVLAVEEQQAYPIAMTREQHEQVQYYLSSIFNNRVIIDREHPQGRVENLANGGIK